MFISLINFCCLGGLCGTFINRKKIEKDFEFPLNCGDLLGIGCPDPVSSKGQGVRV